MDYRDKYLTQHMQIRYRLSASLSSEKQRRWAKKCIEIASRQHRSLFYLMARLWLSEIGAHS